MSIDARNPLNRVGERVVFHHLLNDFVSSWHTLYVPADKKHTPSRILENMVFTLSSITDAGATRPKLHVIDLHTWLWKLQRYLIVPGFQTHT